MKKPVGLIIPADAGPGTAAALDGGYRFGGRFRTIAGLASTATALAAAAKIASGNIVLTATARAAAVRSSPSAGA